MKYKIFNIRVGDIFKKEYRREEFIDRMHAIGEIYFPHVLENRLLSMDMDGLINHDDSGIAIARHTIGKAAEVKYKAYANMNIEAANEGIPYCWYAPLCFAGLQLLSGMPPEFNRVIGRKLRLIPDAKRFVDALSQEAYKITAVTAAHQEAAEEIAKRVGIKDVIGTQIGTSVGLYNGTVKRFIGGTHKSQIVRDILNPNNKGYKGTHIGDSWSDTDTLRDVPYSIAFNPGCELALKNASISVIGSSLLGMLPFFTSSDEYDKELRKDVLPKVIILMGESNNVSLEGLLKGSKIMKTKRIPSRIYKETGKSDKDIEEIIRKELNNPFLKLPIKSNLMSPKKFDEFAKKKYEEFVK